MGVLSGIKIAFIYPATQFDIENHRDALPNGLLSLTSVVERDGAEVDIYDPRFTQQLPEDLSYDIIGFTAMSMQINHALNLAEELRNRGYKGKIAFGGPHASVIPKSLQTHKAVDAIFIGESEISFPAYLLWLQNKKTLPSGVLVKLDDKWIGNSDSPDFVKDLDTLPYPAKYKYADHIREKRIVNLFSTRGCPFNCQFCQPTKRILFGNKVRRRSTDNLVGEIKEMVNSFDITEFSIDDDTFTYSKKDVIDFCQKIKPFGLKWSCQSRSDISEEVLKQMKDSGCWLIFVGAESGSQKILDLMCKSNKVSSNSNFIKNCNKIGIRTWCNIILGYPGESEEDMKQTLKFINMCKPTRVCVSQATPFPGTYLYENNKWDLIEQEWNDMARHIRQPKFKSMKNMQTLINIYTEKISRGWDLPLTPNKIAYTTIIMSYIRNYARKILPDSIRYTLIKLLKYKM